MNFLKPDEIMLNDYIQNKLSEAEEELLEIWLSDHPEVMQDLELDLMFKQGIEKRSILTKIKRLNIFYFFTSSKFIPVHVLAYCLVGFLMFNTVNDSPQVINSSKATFIELEKQRGLDSSIVNIKTENGNSLVLRLFPDSLSEKYNLIVQSKSTKKKFEFNNLIAGDYGSITTTINDNNTIGEWEVVLSTIANKIEQKYLIKIN